MSNFLKELKWLRVREKHVFDIFITVYIVLRRCYPEGFLSFSSVNDVTNSVTRQRNCPYVPRARTDRGAGPSLCRVLGWGTICRPSLLTFKTSPLSGPASKSFSYLQTLYNYFRDKSFSLTMMHQIKQLLFYSINLRCLLFLEHFLTKFIISFVDIALLCTIQCFMIFLLY